MRHHLLTVCAATVLAAGLAAGRTPDDDEKTDLQTLVAEGKELSLTPAEITVSDEKDADGRYTAKVKPGKAAKAFKMPAEGWALGFVPKAAKGGGVTVISVPGGGIGMNAMRTTPNNVDAPGDWQADPGDVVTHVNEYAVNSAEDVVLATSLAKDKTDVRIVLKDADSGKTLVFYVTARKQ